jgi:hypothetical protein
LTFVVLLVLAALWAAVLVPPLLRARTGRSSDSIVDFNHRIGVLSRTGAFSRRRAHRSPGFTTPPPIAQPVMPALPAMPPMPGRTMSGGYRLNASQRAAKRRRDVTLGLGVAAVVMLAFAVLTGTPALWFLQVFVDLLLVSYLALVVYFRSLHYDRAETVRYLQPRHTTELGLPRSPELALRRTASS